MPIFGRKIHFWAIWDFEVMKLFWPSRPIFSQNFPPNTPKWWLFMLWAPFGTLMRVWVIIYAYNNHIIVTQFTKVSLKWSKFAKVIILCVKLIFLVPTDLFLWETPRLGLKWFLWVKNSLFRTRISQQIPPNDTTITKILVNSSLNSQRALHQPFWDLESGNIV